MGKGHRMKLRGSLTGDLHTASPVHLLSEAVSLALRLLSDLIGTGILSYIKTPLIEAATNF